MPATVVNITGPAVAPGVAAGEAAPGPLGAFEAIMSAFFASAEGRVPQDANGGSPFAGEGGPERQRHNLDVSKLPAHAHPAQLAAAEGAGVVDGGLSTTPATGALESLAEAATDEGAATPAVELAPGSDQEEPASGPAVDPAAAAVAAALAQAAPAAAPSTAPQADDGGAAAPSAPSAPAAATQAVETAGAAPTGPETPPAAVAAAPAAGAPLAEAEAETPPPTQSGAIPAKSDEPKTVPGSHASDTARLHASERSAVARAAAAPGAVPGPPPADEASLPPASAGAPGAESGPAQQPLQTPAAPQAQAQAAPTPKPKDKPAQAAGREASGAKALDALGAPSAQAAAGPSAGSPEKAPAPPRPELDPPQLQSAKPEEGAAPPPLETGRAQSASAAQAHPGATEVRGSPETVASLSAQIVRKLGARSTHFDVQLDPAGLGKVNVRVAINADGQVSAAMRFDNPQAAAELKARASELQRALAQSGFDLSGGLSFDVAQDRAGGQGGQQNPFLGDENSGQAFRGRAFAAALETAGDAARAAAPAAFGERRGPAKGVDVRV